MSDEREVINTAPSAHLSLRETWRGSVHRGRRLDRARSGRDDGTGGPLGGGRCGPRRPPGERPGRRVGLCLAHTNWPVLTWARRCSPLTPHGWARCWPWVPMSPCSDARALGAPAGDAPRLGTCRGPLLDIVPGRDSDGPPGRCWIHPSRGATTSTGCAGPHGGVPAHLCKAGTAPSAPDCRPIPHRPLGQQQHRRGAPQSPERHPRRPGPQRRPPIRARRQLIAAHGRLSDTADAILRGLLRAGDPHGESGWRGTPKKPPRPL